MNFIGFHSLSDQDIIINLSFDINMNLLKLVCFFLIPIISAGQGIQEKTHKKNSIIEWFPGDLLQSGNNQIRVLGNPEIINCKYGKALHFNGLNDGIFFEEMPLLGMDEFTIEVLFYPESGGNFEQRFFHCGEILENRLLLELRSMQNDWYFDAFIKSGDQKRTLIDSTLLHPLGQWYHLAFVIDRGKLITYVNKRKELEDNIVLIPFQGGKTSIGVRQNELSWFKGTIYKFKITNKALKKRRFMDY